MDITVKENFVEVTYNEVLKVEQEQVELANKFLSTIKEIYSKKPSQKFSILMDISNERLAIDSTSTKAFFVYKEIVKDKQTEKVAILANDKFSENIVELIFEFIKSRKVNWFTDRKKAELWLGLKA